jgi:hypothetical protein
MTPQSGSSKKRSYAALLSSATLAIALLLSVSSVRAEVVTLVCQQESGDSWTIRVDYDRNAVDMLRGDGSAMYYAPATITQGAVQWEVNEASSVKASPDHAPAGYFFSGSLNRLTGQGRVIYSARYKNGQPASVNMSGPCRRATQKF